MLHPLPFASARPGYAPVVAAGPSGAGGVSARGSQQPVHMGHGSRVSSNWARSGVASPQRHHLPCSDAPMPEADGASGGDRGGARGHVALSEAVSAPALHRVRDAAAMDRPGPVRTLPVACVRLPTSCNQSDLHIFAELCRRQVERRERVVAAAAHEDLVHQQCRDRLESEIRAQQEVLSEQERIAGYRKEKSSNIIESERTQLDEVKRLCSQDTQSEQKSFEPRKAELSAHVQRSFPRRQAANDTIAQCQHQVADIGCLSNEDNDKARRLMEDIKARLQAAQGEEQALKRQLSEAKHEEEKLHQDTATAESIRAGLHRGRQTAEAKKAEFLERASHAVSSLGTVGETARHDVLKLAEHKTAALVAVATARTKRDEVERSVSQLCGGGVSDVVTALLEQRRVRDSEEARGLHLRQQSAELEVEAEAGRRSAVEARAFLAQFLDARLLEGCQDGRVLQKSLDALQQEQGELRKELQRVVMQMTGIREEASDGVLRRRRLRDQMCSEVAELKDRADQEDRSAQASQEVAAAAFAKQRQLDAMVHAEMETLSVNGAQTLTQLQRAARKSKLGYADESSWSHVRTACISALQVADIDLLR